MASSFQVQIPSLVSHYAILFFSAHSLPHRESSLMLQYLVPQKINILIINEPD